jgi:hypothetical protein
MADYRRDPIYLFDRFGWFSLSLVFYEEKFPVWSRYSWGVRPLAFLGRSYRFKRDRWSFDTPWVSLFVEVWFLSRF